MKLHNTYKEVTKVQSINLLPPKLEKNTWVLHTGADSILDEYRVGKNMAIVFQVIYQFKLETKDKVLTERLCISEHLYLPMIEVHELTQTEEIKD